MPYWLYCLAKWKNKNCYTTNKGLEKNMKYLDSIIITTNKYEDIGITKGTKGAIILSAIRNNTFECELFNVPSKYKIWPINICDMIVEKSSNITDKQILEDLPKHDPHWWCKVENGFILNLLGEKKNKVAYNYNT